jgi:hypothetical protein
MACRDSFHVDHSALTNEDLRRADAIPHKPEMMAEGHTVGLRAILEFHNWCVLPALNTLVNPTPRELALKLLYGRIRLLADTLLVLRNVRHFQSIVGASRTAIELYIDMHLLARNAIENGPDKFFAFDRVQRLKAAKRMVAFHDRYPNLRERGVDTFRTFIAAQGAAIDAERVRLWGEGARPDHWTNINFYQRPNDLGQEFQRLVNDGYDYRNWQLHSGAAAVNGLTDEALTALSANALHVVHTITIGSLELIATELRVRQSIENFAVRLEDLRLIPGLVLADIRLQSVGEPQRVFITHPQPVAAAPM